MEGITDDDVLYRRILDYHYVRAENRISSSAFMKGKRVDQEVSVFLAKEAEPQAILDAGLPKQLLAELTAGVPREVELEVERDPLDHGPPGHCIITGFVVDGNQWKRQCEHLASRSRILEFHDLTDEEVADQ